MSSNHHYGPAGTSRIELKKCLPKQHLTDAQKQAYITNPSFLLYLPVSKAAGNPTQSQLEAIAERGWVWLKNVHHTKPPGRARMVAAFHAVSTPEERHNYLVLTSIPAGGRLAAMQADRARSAKLKVPPGFNHHAESHAYTTLLEAVPERLVMHDGKFLTGSKIVTFGEYEDNHNGVGHQTEACTTCRRQAASLNVRCYRRSEFGHNSPVLRSADNAGGGAGGSGPASNSRLPRDRREHGGQENSRRSRSPQDTSGRQGAAGGAAVVAHKPAAGQSLQTSKSTKRNKVASSGGLFRSRKAAKSLTEVPSQKPSRKTIPTTTAKKSKKGTVPAATSVLQNKPLGQKKKKRFGLF